MEQVYIFDFGDKIKVGFSSNVEKRLRTIELSSGTKAKQVYAVNTSRQAEQIAHTWLENRLEGEFFAFPFDKAKSIVEDIVQGKITTNKPAKSISCGHIRYKIDVLLKLKEAGYSSTRIRKEKLIGQSYLQQLRHGEIVSWKTIEIICELLNCQPGDIVEYVKE